MNPPNDSFGNNARPGRAAPSRTASPTPDHRFRPSDAVPPQPGAPAIPASGMIPMTPWTPEGFPAKAKGLKPAQ
jgi:hypothetical protein